MIAEAKKKKVEKVFVETDPQLPFPDDCMTRIRKKINTFAKDLEVNWDSAIEIVDAAFMELNVPKPDPWLKNRYVQYSDLLKFGVESLKDARGFGGSWNSVIK